MLDLLAATDSIELVLAIEVSSGPVFVPRATTAADAPLADRVRSSSPPCTAELDSRRFHEGRSMLDRISP